MFAICIFTRFLCLLLTVVTLAFVGLLLPEVFASFCNFKLASILFTSSEIFLRLGSVPLFKPSMLLFTLSISVSIASWNVDNSHLLPSIFSNLLPLLVALSKAFINLAFCNNNSVYLPILSTSFLAFSLSSSVFVGSFEILLLFSIDCW